MNNFTIMKLDKTAAIVFISILVIFRAESEVVTRLDTNEKVVALTFDVCETVTPSYFDKKILSYLLKNNIPFTLFVSGKFALRNKTEISFFSGHT